MQKQAAKQQGFVSIIVAMILIALVSLIAVGFAFLVRQNQRASLNRQLSSQAFYAAESGINDAVAELRNNPSIERNQCNQTPSATATLATGVQYTCVLINPRPDKLEYASISSEESTITHITAASGQQISSLQIAWQSTDPTANTFALPTYGMVFPQEPTFKPGSTVSTSTPDYFEGTATFPRTIGVLRTTVIPTSAIGSVDGLLNNSQTFFLYPKATHNNASLGTVAATPENNGTIVSGRCSASNTPRKCMSIITGVPNDFYLRLKAIYHNVSVTITAKDASGADVPLAGAQAVVDATGKAQDTVRRIQVRVPLMTDYYFPEFGIESGSTICKRLAGYAGAAWALDPPTELWQGGSNAPNNEALDREACRIDN